MSSLKVGAVRYGVLCGVDGMVLDDGTVFRLGAEKFLVTTTTGNAAKILDWMEEWLQTEWPGLRVWCTSVTEQWATMAVVGPQSRELIGSLAADLDVDVEAFPFMTWRDGVVAGLPARVARVSFSGELAYEVNVAWSDAAALWDAVWAAGEPVGLTPYGTETMHVLRAEKGYPIVGQDTDGTITPQDLGMSWAVSKKKPDYLGKRSHARPDNLRADRKQLIGLLPEDEALVLPEGCQLVEDAVLPEPPVPMIGHVTSSYPSVALGRPFALALCRSGRSRIGGRVHVVVDGVPRPCAVVAPVLVDPENLRRDGDPATPVLGEVTTVAAGLPVSPLAGFATVFHDATVRPGSGVHLGEEALDTQINLRVRRGSAGLAAAEGVLGLTLPGRTGDVTRGDDLEVLALGPDEFLVLSGPGHARELDAGLRAAVSGDGSVVDVSSARTVVRISGPRARDVLRHGTSINLDRLAPDTCAQTLLAQCAVILLGEGVPGAEDDLIRIFVRSSFAAHLATWLLETVPEYT
jgi:sarcosine oxidase, subunit alpha